MSRLSSDAGALPQATQSTLTRYATATVFVAVAIALRTWLDPVMGHSSVAVFMVAILGGAWIGGVGPALVCLVILHIVHGYWFQTPAGLWEPNLASVVTVGGWYGVGITVGILSQMRTAAHRRAHDQQVEASSQREQLRTTLLCMADGVVLTDRDGRISLMNPAAENLTGWKLVEAKGKLWSEVLVLDNESHQETIENPILEVVRDNQVVHSKLPLLLSTRNQQTVPIAYSAAPVRAIDGQISGVVFAFRDESERRRNQRALEDADRRKDEFLAVLGHELRNPLAPICAGLELLKESSANPQEREEVRTMMQRQAQHLARLIDDLLDVSRITRGKLELRKSKVQLEDIVRDAVASTQPLFEQSEHHLAVRLPDTPVLLYADSGRLTQVVTNVLNNAAKYTPRGGRIEVVAEHVGAEVTLTVSDSGIGIPADKLDCVFDMFTQSHEAREYGHTGLGIGLTLVKRLVEMHQGAVAIQSAGQNLGTKVTIRLPTLSERQATINGETQQSTHAAVGAKHRVLIVDDHADALESLSRLVALMGHEVRQARDALAALDIGPVFLPDVVLMDLGMPGVNGYDAARLIRKEWWGRHLALVASTGWGRDEDRRSTAEAGFDYHLVKPITMAGLREVFESLVADLRKQEVCANTPKDSIEPFM